MTVWSPPKPAVLAALAILEAVFPGVPVSTKMPRKDRPSRFIRVTRAGGSQDNPATDDAHMLVECFGVDTATVETMCNTARAALRQSAGTIVATDIFIRWWHNEQGPVDFPHPEIIDRERWQFHGDLSVKAN